jgi:hypothetical protein
MREHSSRLAIIGLPASSVAAELQLEQRAKAALDEFVHRTPVSPQDSAEARALYSRVAPGEQPDAPLQLRECMASPKPPTVPDGTAAELAEMLQAQSRVQGFMRDSTAYLECLDEIIDGDNEERIRELALNEYNRMVDITQRLGNEFNKQVRAFRARQ